MGLKVVVLNTQWEEKKTKNGVSYGVQRVGLDTGDGYRAPFRVSIEAGQPYPVGEYTIDPASFVVNQYGDLGLGRVRLLPFKQASAAQKAG
jgi:hypothetical protein